MNTDMEAQEYLNHTDDTILGCRGQGHSWPKLHKTGKGIRIVREREGGYQIVSICSDCGMERTLTTLPNGIIEHPAKYQYRQPKGYKAPKGSNVSRRDCLDELWRRVLEDIK